MHDENMFFEFLMALLQVVAWPQVGPHLTSIEAKRIALWTHSDAEGVFYMLQMDYHIYDIQMSNVLASSQI